METISLDIRGAVATITLNRPQVKNAFNDVFVRELASTFKGFDETVRVVVLKGAGDVFSAGADLQWMQSTASLSPEENAAAAFEMGHLFQIIDEAHQVVIGKIHGAALGGGLGLVSCCDIVVAAPNTRFGLTEVRLGLVPAVISPFVVKKIGESQARRYFVTGEMFDGVTAQRLGLVHEVADGDELEKRTQLFVEQVLKGGPIAVGLAKALVRRVRRESIEEVAPYTSRLIADLRISPEAQDGLMAFLSKQPPSWLEQK